MIIRIDDDVALDILMNRVGYWTEDITVIKLFEKMYKNEIENGCFDYGEFDVNEIVDNDYINWCTVIWKSEECYNDLKELADAEEYDISCKYDKNWGYSFIEAQYGDAILVRS